MKWNAFSFFLPAFEKTKKRLLPFNFKEWFKLAIMNILAGGSGGGSGSGNSGNFGGGDNSGSGGEAVSRTFAESVKLAFAKYWVLGAVILSIVLVLGIVLSYIRSVFTFIFLESVINKKAKFAFGKNNSKGISLFLFNFVVSLISLIVVAGLVFPVLYNLYVGAAFSWGYVIFAILALLVFFLLLWFWLLFLHDLVVPYMYSNGVSALFGLKKIWADVRKNKVGALVYWVARLLVGLGIGVVSFIILIPVLIVFLLVAGLITGLGYLIYSAVGGLTFFIVLAAVLGIVVLILFILAMAMLTLPFSVFAKYFGLMNFETLTKIKILKI